MTRRSLRLIKRHQAAHAGETREPRTDATAQRSIQDLPTELFLEILHALYASIFTLSSNHSRAWEQRESARLQWMVVLGVCQRWRQVICAEKQFWRVVDVFRTLRWLSLCLTRAKAVDIYFHTSTSPSGLLSLLRSHDPAVRSLHFKPRSVGEGWVKFLQKFLSRPVALEVLDVSYVHRYSSSRPMHPSTLVGFNLEFPAS